MANKENNSDKSRMDPNVYEFAVKGLMTEVAKEISTLEQLKDDDKARIPHEEKLKEYFQYVFDKLPRNAQIFYTQNKAAQKIDEARSDEHSAPGIIDHSNNIETPIIMKIKEGRGDIPPQVLHAINVNDWKTFEKDKNFHMAKVYDLIKQVDPYVMIQDRYSNADSKKKTFVQIVELIPGKNIAQLAPKNGSKIIDKAVKDIFHWHKKAPELEEKMDVEKINKGYIKDLDDAVENAIMFTNCRLTDEDLEAFKESKKTIQLLLGGIEHGYGRVLDSVLRNIMLKLDNEKFEKEDGAYLAKLAKDEGYINENLVHIDPRERYGHIYEDFHNLDSEVSQNMRVHGRKMFRRGSRSQFRDYIAKNSEKFSDIAFELIGSDRAIRRRDYTISRYVRRLFNTKETRPNFKQELENYEHAVRCLDHKAEENAYNLAELLNRKNYSSDAESMRNFAKFVSRLNFTKFTFDKETK